jgi:acyl dehydratase
VTIREVSKSPSMLSLYVRAALPLVPGASRVPGLPVPKGRDLPDLEIVLRDVRIDHDHVAAYSGVCGFAPGDDLPATYPHILAFPLHMALMTDGSFPIAPVGLVHVENRIVARRPVARTEPLSLRVFATGLAPDPNGRRFSIVTEARTGDELVWEESSTMLRRESGAPGRERGPATRGVQAAVPTQWEVPSDTGRRYAAVSGDRNPIHLYDLTAKLFGFPRAIAHGMWTKARCLAALEGELPEAFTVAVEFRRPILLPATVSFAREREDGGIRFSVRDAKTEKAHLDGTVATR